MRRTIIAAAIGVLALAAPVSASANPGSEYAPPAGYVTSWGETVPVGGMTLVNADLHGAAHWQICGVNVADTLVAPTCDNSSSSQPQPGGKNALVNVDLHDAAHWQICGINVAASGPPATCDNTH